jgi:hypothetical protein
VSGPAEVRELWRARTLSGSRYDLMVDVAGRYWVRGQNVVTPRSDLVGMDDWYEIARPAPWPPQMGSPVIFVAPDDPDAKPARGPFGGTPAPAHGAPPGARWLVPVAYCGFCQESWPTVDAPPPTWSSLSRGIGASGGH